jgi:hypothetical protein
MNVFVQRPERLKVVTEIWIFQRSVLRNTDVQFQVWKYTVTVLGSVLLIGCQKPWLCGCKAADDRTLVNKIVMINGQVFLSGGVV